MIKRLILWAIRLILKGKHTVRELSRKECCSVDTDYEFQIPVFHLLDFVF
jgi:hypothetical protein